MLPDAGQHSVPNPAPNLQFQVNQESGFSHPDTYPCNVLILLLRQLFGYIQQIFGRSANCTYVTGIGLRFIHDSQGGYSDGKQDRMASRMANGIINRIASRKEQQVERECKKDCKRDCKENATASRTRWQAGLQARLQAEHDGK